MMNRIITRINRHIPANFRKNKAICKGLELLYNALTHFDFDFKDELNKAVMAYCQYNPKVDNKCLCRDMIKEFTQNWVTPTEYVRFDLFDKSQEVRRTYIPDYEEISICKWTKGHNILPDSKCERYMMFSKYFRRKVLCISPNVNITEFEYADFINGLTNIIVKPLRGTKGHGVQIIDVESVPTLSEFKSRFRGDYLVEEAIVQGEELGKFHPSSVNTVRFVTGIDRTGGYHNLFALLRIGQGGSIVDNVSSGGLVALINGGGVICSNAFRGMECFSNHPDTNEKFVGAEIPEWEQICLLVRDIHMENPGQYVFGFDLAWTKRGWDLIEINPAPSFDSYQQLTGKGIRPYLTEIGML